jgi:dTDP-4-dehydrorhamnose reductase
MMVEIAGRRRILIVGAQGQLGVELQRAFFDAGDVTAMGRDRCDLGRPDTIREAIAEVRPEIILNAAAYTAVDRAESEPELAHLVNGEAPGILAEEARKLNALLVHYSTDYVFDGSKAGAWSEGDAPNPLNVYGASKLQGERNIAQAGASHLIFRTSWVYSPHGQNFMRTMLRLGRERDQLKIVDNQIGAPTSAWALAKATREVIDHLATSSLQDGDDRSGIYHMTCAGQTSWCGFAQEIFRNSPAPENRSWPSVTGIPDTDYPTPARRPKNSVLLNAKLKDKFGVSLPDWTTALHETLQTLQVQQS